MLSVEPAPPNFDLPEDAICLTPTGWRHERYEVIIQLHQTTTLAQALQAIWNQQGNLLGDGDLVFKQTSADPYPKGFLVFVPKPE